MDRSALSASSIVQVSVMKPSYDGSEQSTDSGPLKDVILGAGTCVTLGVAAGASVGGASVAGASVTGGALGASVVHAQPLDATDVGAALASPLGEVVAAGDPPSRMTTTAISAIAATATPMPIRMGWMGTMTFGSGVGAEGSATGAWRSAAHFQQNVRVGALAEWQTGQVMSAMGLVCRPVRWRDRDA